MMAAGQVSRFVQPRAICGGRAGSDCRCRSITSPRCRREPTSPGSPGRASSRWPALPFLFLTITSYSYVGLPPGKSGQASALINVARNLGGSIGVSASQTLLARRRAVPPGRDSTRTFQPHVGPLCPRAQARRGISSLQHGTSAANAQHQASAWIGQTLMNQAAFLSYIDVFAALSLFALLLVPAAFLLQRVELGAPRQSETPASH